MYKRCTFALLSRAIAWAMLKSGLPEFKTRGWKQVFSSVHVCVHIHTHTHTHTISHTPTHSLTHPLTHIQSLTHSHTRTHTLSVANVRDANSTGNKQDRFCLLVSIQNYIPTNLNRKLGPLLALPRHAKGRAKAMA